MQADVLQTPYVVDLGFRNLAARTMQQDPWRVQYLDPCDLPSRQLHATLLCQCAFRACIIFVALVEIDTIREAIDERVQQADDPRLRAVLSPTVIS